MKVAQCAVVIGKLFETFLKNILQQKRVLRRKRLTADEDKANTVPCEHRSLKIWDGFLRREDGHGSSFPATSVGER
jgi:hypothetical protein